MQLNFKRQGNGRPLLILHGLFGSLDNWMTLAKDFAEHYEVFAIDQRNHGKSPHDEVTNYDTMSNDLLQFIEEHEIEEPVLMGHSMGGKTVMNFELNNPGIIHKLIVVDSAPKTYPVHHQTILDGLRSLNFDIIKNRSQADGLLAKYITEPGVRQFLLKSLYWKTNEELALRFNLNSLQENIEIISGWPELIGANSNIDTLFIRGGRSNYIDENDISIPTYFSNSNVITIEDAGHWVHAEKPKELFDAVVNFI